MGALLHGGEQRQRCFLETLIGDYLDSALTDERIRAAIAAYHSDSDGWRALWVEVLNLLTMRMAAQELADIEVPPIPGEAMRMFGLLTLMFADLERGAIPRLAAPKPVSNRRPDSLTVRMNRVDLAVLAGLELHAGRKEGIRNEHCFRKASERLRKAGSNIPWKEIRSTWQNRHRLDSFSLEVLEGGLRSSHDPNWPSEHIRDEQAAKVARNIQNPPSYDANG